MMDFKVSDWVRIKTPIFEYDGTDRIAEGIKKLSIKDMWIFDENHFKMNPDRYIVHWKPQEGEWVIPNTKTTESFNVFRYTENYKGFDLQPFIGELPSFLKETDNATN